MTKVLLLTHEKPSETAELKPSKPFPFILDEYGYYCSPIFGETKQAREKRVAKDKAALNRGEIEKDTHLTANPTLPRRL